MFRNLNGTLVAVFRNLGSKIVSYLIVSNTLFPVLSILHAQIILTEIMFDPDTLESHNEYVEIFNPGLDSVNLSNWTIGDADEPDLLMDAGSGLVIQPSQYGIILDASYFDNSSLYDSLIPEAALVLTIEDGSFGRYGWSNTASEPVILISSEGDTVQVYLYTPDNLPGYSDEKIFLTPDNAILNWKNSQNLHGTPGFENSVSPRITDMGIDSVWTDPEYPLENGSFILHAALKNYGKNLVTDCRLTVFSDKNRDGFPDQDEILSVNNYNMELNYGDSLILDWELSGLKGGVYSLAVLVECTGDNYTENDFIAILLTIENGDNPVIINEIMYQPSAGQAEWVELFNPGSSAINLRNWKISDMRDTVLITDKAISIPPLDYAVISKDSTVTGEFNLPLSKVIVLKSLPTLNNDEDDLKIFSASGRMVERVNYFHSWMGRETTTGTSLERIRPDISSALADNWAACVDISGATPGRQNSIFVTKVEEQAEFSIHPNPFSPDQDGFEDYSVIDYKLPFATGYMTVDIYDITGRRIRRLADYQPIGQSGSFVWNGQDSRGRIARMGIYIILCRIFNPEQDIYREFKKTVVLVKRN